MSCQSLRIQLTEIKEGMQGLDTAIQQFLTDPEAYNTYPEVSEKLAGLMELRKKFIAEYRQNAYDLLLNWLGVSNNDDIKNVVFEENGRVAFTKDLYKWQKTTYFPQIIRAIKGHFAFEYHDTPTNMDFLEETGNISNIKTTTSMKRLRRVNGYFDVPENMENLESLEYVEQYIEIDARNKVLKSLPSLVLAQDIDCTHTELAEMPKLKKAGIITMTSGAVRAMDELEEAISIEAGRAALSSLKKLRRLSAETNLSQTGIEDLPELEFCGGSLELGGCEKFSSAPKLAEIRRGGLGIVNTAVTDFRKSFPNLKVVESKNANPYLGISTSTPDVAQQLVRLRNSGELQTGRIEFIDYTKGTIYERSYL